jgi:hypothetical protein
VNLHREIDLLVDHLGSEGGFCVNTLADGIALQIELRHERERLVKRAGNYVRMRLGPF